AIDNVGFDGFNGCVVKAVPCYHTGPEIFDENVDRSSKLANESGALRRSDVYRQRLFAAIERSKSGRRVGIGTALHGAKDLAQRRRFDLDDFGAQLSQIE